MDLNTLINKLLDRALDGDTGSNIIGAVATSVIAGSVNYEHLNQTAEQAKLAGAIVAGVFAWFVGKRGKK